MFTLQSSPPPYPLLWLRGLFSWPCAAITRRDPLILKSLLSKFVDLKGVTRPFPGGFYCLVNILSPYRSHLVAWSPFSDL